MTTTRTRLFALLAVGALTFAACGSDDKDSDKADTETTAGSTDTTDSASVTDETTDNPNSGAADPDVDAPDADDQAMAEAAGLNAGDVPGDFIGTPPAPSSQDGVFDNPVEGCEFLTDIRDLGTVTAKAKSDDYASPAGDERVASTIRVWDDSESASEVLALIGDERTPGCVRDGLMEAMSNDPSGAVLEDVTAEVESLPLGDEGLTIWVTGTISADGQSSPLAFALSFVRVGRSVALVQYMWLGGEPDSELLGGYSAIVADRLNSFAD